MATNLSNWRIEDNFPNEVLENVFPISERVKSLISRNKTKNEISDKALELLGCIQMIKSLEYHSDNFFTLKRTMTFSSVTNTFSLDEYYNDVKIKEKIYHEIIAYFNRIGQFYYFAKSQFVKDRIDDSVNFLMPKIKELIPFRMKYSAHRSIDYPMHESHNEKIAQSISLLGSGFLFDSNGNLKFQMQNKGNLIEFQMEIDHSIIVVEIYSIIERVVLR